MYATVRRYEGIDKDRAFATHAPSVSRMNDWKAQGQLPRSPSAVE